MNGKNKIERYIERYCSKMITKKVYSQRSTYYHFGNKCIRVSDHVALNSDGHLSIILDCHDESHFIVHAVITGEISVVTYEELKEIIRCMRLLPSIVHIANIPPKEPKPVQIVTKAVKTVTKEVIDPTHVFGYPIQEFKHTHQIALQGILKSHIKEAKKKK